MTKVKACKIEQESDYPCPCSKPGQLCPIVLTDAFGCSHCQQIFVIRSDGYVLEQISSIHPYRQHWYWTGQTWKLLRPPFFQNKAAWFVGTLTVLIALFFCLMSVAKVPLVPPPMVWMVLLFFIPFMAWLILYQRS